MEGHEAPADVFFAVIVFAGTLRRGANLRKFGLKYNWMCYYAPIRKVNLGLVGKEAVGNQAAA